MDNQISGLMAQLPQGTWSSLLGWPFISCCICLAVLILTLKRAFSQMWPLIYAKGSTHGLFTLSYLVAGFLAAVPKTYLHGPTYFDRAIVGILASGASLAVYHAALKRLGMIIGVKDSYLSDPDDKEVVTKEEVKPAEVSK
jgi:hypothetical protein